MKRQEGDDQMGGRRKGGRRRIIRIRKRIGKGVEDPNSIIKNREKEGTLNSILYEGTELY